MGISFWLYDAPEGCGPVNRWDSMQARPLGSADELQARLAGLFPFVRWRRTTQGQGWSGLGTDPATDRYVDVLLLPEAEAVPSVTPGVIHFVSLRKAAPSVTRLVMEALHLNRACCIDSGVLVDPCAYEDGDRTYAGLEEKKGE